MRIGVVAASVEHQDHIVHVLHGEGFVNHIEFPSDLGRWSVETGPKIRPGVESAPKGQGVLGGVQPVEGSQGA